jgi:ribose-phosphate pyrophosphokinase
MKFDPNSDEFSCARGSIKVEWIYENDAELFALICVKKHLDRHFTNPHVVLIMPYIPHARMDRVKSDEDVFTLKYFCEVINSLKFDIVWVRDAHSNVSLALLDNVIDEGVVHYVR